MAKQQKNQIYVLKIHSGYLSKHNWHLDFRLSEIRKQPQMVVSLGSSQVLRWLTKLQNRENDDSRATEIKKEIKNKILYFFYMEMEIYGKKIFFL